VLDNDVGMNFTLNKFTHYSHINYD